VASGVARSHAQAVAHDFIVRARLTFESGTPGTSPPSHRNDRISLTVQHKDTGTFGFGSTSVPCAGSPHDAVVVVTGGPFVPGTALANGFGCGLFCDTDFRQIQIVV
jgi:hypothetical protein